MSTEITLPQATVGIVTALPKEHAAVCAVFQTKVRAAGVSGTVYDLCTVPCVGGQIIVAITQFLGMGNNLAAAQTSRMLSDCESIRHVIMVGIAGAIPCPEDANKHVRLGDIVVSSSHGVFQFDFGKHVQGKPFEYLSVPTKPSARLISAINRLMSLEEMGQQPWLSHIAQACRQFPEWHRPNPDTDILDDGTGTIPHPVDTNRKQEGVPRLFVGAIASSNAVLKDAEKRNAIVAAALGAGRVLCCVEMEGSGVQDATWVHDGVGYLIVRGTCDYCNEKKNKQWQHYAALIAAAFARSLVEVLPSPPPSSSAPTTLPVLSSPQANSFGIVESNAHITIYNINGGQINLQLGSQFVPLADAVPRMFGPRDNLRKKCQTIVANKARDIGLHILLWLRTVFQHQKQVPDDWRLMVWKCASDIRDALSQWDFEKAGDFVSALDLLLVEYEGVLRDGSMLDAVVSAARAHINMVEVHGIAVGKHFKRAKTLVTQIETGTWGSAQDRWDEIIALKASLVSVEHGPDAGLALLDGRTDSYAIRTRTALLLNQQKTVEAMRIVEGMEPHERWCDVAVRAYALNDHIEKAQTIVQWAASLSDRRRYSQCVVRLAQALMVRALAGHDKSVNILPRDITQAEHDKLEALNETLHPVLQPILAAGKPSSSLDIVALQIAFQANHLLQRRTAVAENLRMMLQWTPVPIEAARGVLGGYIAAPPNLPDRLSKDHPGDLDAGILAAVIQSVSFGLHTEAFVKAKDLLPLANSSEKKEELFKLFQQIWQNINGPAAAECESIAGSLVEHNPRLHAMFEGSIALRRGDPDQTIAILDGKKSENDPYWLQLRANALLQKQDLAEAVDFLLAAAKKTNDAGLLHKTGDVAFKAGRYDVAVWCYERLAEIQPCNLSVRSNLAHIYTFILHDLEKATIQFQALRVIEPTNVKHTFNLAICLAQLFRPDESLQLFNELCQQESPSLSTVLGRAQLYHSVGQPAVALESLEPFRERLWSDPNFLMVYMTTAHAAGKDKAGNEALMELNRLREKGAVKSEVLRMVQKDEALDMFKQSFKQTQDRNEFLHGEMLKGRMPWVWAEQMSNNAIYWGWRTRTQKMGWVGDEPTNRARFCIYSTNGFNARESDHGRRELLPLECPPTGTRIVADISALITLHRLDLLDAAAEHFGEVLVPAGYLPSVLEDSRQMVLHQRLLQQSAEQISKQVAAGHITILPEGKEAATSMPFVDEYADSAEHRYRLRDLIGPVHHSGLVSDEDYVEISRLFTKPAAVDEKHPALRQFQAIMLDLTTLEPVAHTGLMDALTNFYRIHITAQEYREVIQRLDAIACQEGTRQWHMDLWNRLRGNARFKFVPHIVPVPMRGEDGEDREDKDYLAFLACFIAQDTKTPLLADDRVCQAFTLNENANVPRGAFGSDIVAMALMAAGKLEPSKAATAILQLIEWRYRFIVPPPEVLKFLADQYRENAPGQSLQRVAEYVHDCMRDAGLFGGPENTEIKESMAMRLYLKWVTVAAEFLILIWADQRFTPESATRLTKWICQELLPSSPVVMTGPMKVQISEMTPRLLLSNTLLHSIDHYGEPRMADAMTAIKNAMLLTDDEYMRIVTGILNDTARRATKS
ncbi:MAG: hypothetical protein GX634_10460 [Lentisphaerae bacterium]|nr:hypothetical protein [Lentisphaerota bacterium]